MTDTAFTAPAVTGVSVDAVAPAVASVTGTRSGHVTSTAANALTFPTGNELQPSAKRSIRHPRNGTVHPAHHRDIDGTQAAYVSGSGHVSGKVLFHI